MTPEERKKQQELQESAVTTTAQSYESIKENYAWNSDKKCVDYLAHNINWCGDCYACSNCALIFIPRWDAELAKATASARADEAEHCEKARREGIEQGRNEADWWGEKLKDAVESGKKQARREVLEEVQKEIEKRTTMTNVPDNPWNKGYFDALYDFLFLITKLKDR